MYSRDWLWPADPYSIKWAVVHVLGDVIRDWNDRQHSTETIDPRHQP